METAMSDLFDEYPMLIFALEIFVALFVVVFIVVWTSSGRKKANRQQQREDNVKTK
jgi:heme/copper-type cytochrome/quinol oxidase subunit 2